METSNQIEKLQKKVLTNLLDKVGYGLRAHFSSEDERSDAAIKSQLKALAEKTKTTASMLVTEASNQNPKQKEKLLTLAKEADHEIGQALILNALGVSPLFQQKEPAMPWAKDALAEKTTALLKEMMKDSTKSPDDFLKDELTKMKLATTPPISNAPLIEAALTKWRATAETDPILFYQAYVSELQKRDANPELSNPELNNPEKNPLLAAALQLKTMAEAGAKITQAQKPRQDAIEAYKNENWQIDPQKKLAETLGALTQETLEEKVLRNFSQTIDAFNESIATLKDTLTTDKNPTSTTVETQTKATEALHLTIAGMLQNALTKTALLKAVSEEHLNNTLMELSHVRTMLLSTTRAKLHRTPDNTEEMTASTKDKKATKALQSLANTANNDQKLSVTIFELDPMTRELIEKPFTDSKGNAVEPTGKELLLAIENMNAEIREHNAALSKAGSPAAPLAALQVIQKGNTAYSVMCPNQEITQKFRQLLIRLQENRLEKKNEEKNETGTVQAPIPENAEEASTPVIHRSTADGTDATPSAPGATPAEDTPLEQATHRSNLGNP